MNDIVPHNNPLVKVDAPDAIVYIEKRNLGDVNRIYDLTPMAGLEGVMLGRDCEGDHLEEALGEAPLMRTYTAPGTAEPMRLTVPGNWNIVSRANAFVTNWVDPETREQAYLLTDLGSANGTYVNGQKITMRALDPRALPETVESNEPVGWLPSRESRLANKGVQTLKEGDIITLGSGTSTIEFVFHDRRSPFQREYGTTPSQGEVLLPTGMDLTSYLTVFGLRPEDKTTPAGAARDALVTYMLANYEIMQERDPFRVLGVEKPKADMRSLRVARNTLARLYHEDRLDSHQRKDEGWRLVQEGLSMKVLVAYRIAKAQLPTEEKKK